MRQAIKNLMYTVVNSRAYSDEAIHQGLHTWQIVAIVIDVVLAAVLIGLEVIAVRGYQERRKAAK